MSKRICFAPSLFVVLVLGLWSARASAQTTSAGPYYAVPAWDQSLPGNTRFLVLSNFNSEAVLDRETGLVWERSPEAVARPWSDPSFAPAGGAMERCNRRRVASRFGWRLPTAAELGTLVDLGTPFGQPRLPAGHPFLNVQTDNYWTATPVPADPTVAMVVSFANADVGFGPVSALHYAWCVRGPGN